MRLHWIAPLVAVAFTACGDLEKESRESSKSALVAGSGIYADALGSGWYDWSWATRNLANTSPVASGTRSIAVTYGPWQGLYFHHAPGVPLTELTHLELQVNGGATANPAIAVKLTVGGTERTRVALGPYCAGGQIPANAWTTCRVPLTALGASGATIDGLMVQENAGRSLPVMYVDAISLTGSEPAPSPEPSPTPTPTMSWLYRDALLRPWSNATWATANFSSRKVVAVGRRSIAASFKAWQGLYFKHAGFSTSNVSSLKVMVHGGSGGDGAALRVRALVGGQLTSGTDLGPTCAAGKVVAGSWTTCTVPVTAFAPAGSTITGLQIEEWRGGTIPTIYFDEIGFESSGSTTTPEPEPEPVVAVSISPTTASLTTSGQRQFSASVSGSTDTSVTWSVQEAGGGTVSSSGLYTAPASAGTFHVIARSVADSTRSATATVTVTEPTTTPPETVAVSVSPASASVVPGGKQSFTALVTGTTTTTVTWKVQEGSAGGSVDASGLYTAPATSGTYHVVATSTADPTRSATATVSVAPAGNATGILPADRRTVWKPGIPGGVPNVTTIHTTINASTYGNGSTDARGAIETALAAAAATAKSTGQRQVVYLPAGTYRLSGTLQLKSSNVVLRGAGPGKTILRASGTRALWIGELWPNYSSTKAIDVVGSVYKGATSLTVADATSIQPGDILQIDQVEDGDAMGTYGWVWRFDIWWSMRVPYSKYPNMGVEGNGPDSPSGHRPIGQMIEVASKSGNTLQLANTIHIDFPAAQKPQVWNTRARNTQYVGLEDLTVRGGRDDMIIMARASSYSWLKNVESNGAVDSFSGKHIDMGGFRNTIRDSYVHHSSNYNPGGNAYGIMFNGTDGLIENNIVYMLNKPVVGETCGGGNVIGYNYVDEAVLGSPTGTWQETAIDASHGSFCHNVLMEGNFAPNIGTDATHGNNGWNVFFRNHASGENTSGYVGGPLRAIGVDGRNMEHTSVGNVLLTPALAYGKLMGTPSAKTSPSTPVAYLLGPNTWDSRGNMSFDVWDDGTTAALFYRHMDYDYVTKQVYYDPANGVRVLPDSLYLTSKPAFFGSNAWPWVNPLGATDADRLKTLPAKARFQSM